MSLSFVGPAGGIERRWIVFALLRDNVQHHLEAGTPSAAFEQLHSVTEALGGRSLEVPAKALRAEVQRAKKELTELKIEQLAISMRTRAVIALDWPPPVHRETALARELDIQIPLLHGGEVTLDDVFGSLIDELLRITEGASDEDVVHVHDL